MPSALEWDKVARIDADTLQEYEKEKVDEVFSMLALVIVHTSLHLSFNELTPHILQTSAAFYCFKRQFVSPTSTVYYMPFVMTTAFYTKQTILLI